MESYQKAIISKHVLPPDDLGNTKKRHKVNHGTESIISQNSP
jgi:hypothetical protein